MVGEILTFDSVPVGALFWSNGNLCRKRSRRTAAVGNYGLFYFGLREVVTLGVPA